MNIFAHCLTKISKSLSSLSLVSLLSICASACGIARHTTTALIDEYNVEFCKYKKSAPSFGFTGRSHSAKVRAVISKTTIERNKARASMCKEQGLNYRTYRQDADAQIEVANFSNNYRLTSISSDNIII